ncbi:hypothetical protein KY342_00485 [Candidatus Woesearchaeota archaeon]|nr:hypothetical protein [Candidatus Woesearchaeota archaeon]
MKKLELEALLEGGLYALGVPLQRRVCMDELLVGEQIDESFSGTSVHELLTKHGFSRGLIEEIVRRGMSFKKVEDWFSGTPYFRRTSSQYKGITLEYNAYKITGFRKIKNLREDHFRQDVRMFDGELRIATVDCRKWYPKKEENKVKVDIPRRVLRERKFDPAIQTLMELNGKKFDPYEVYCAVMDFLKQTEPFGK